MTVVVFDPTAFKVRYPVFAAVSDALLYLCFDDATLILSNSDDSPVQNATRRTQLLNMLVAHIAYLGGALNPSGGAVPVGRVSQATQGSVSASMDYRTPEAQAWFSQTQWGVLFLQATLNLRSFRYIPHNLCIR